MEVECWIARDECIDGPELIPACVDSFPTSCTGVTLEEFVTCRIDALTSFLSDNATISCDSPAQLPTATVPSTCAAAYERCPELQDLLPR
jgi:hypothetical protein